MRARRTFQIASAMLALIYAVVLLATTVMLLLPIFGSNMFEPFNGWGHNVSNNIVPKVSFLPQDGPWGGVLVVAVMFLVPAILMFLAMLVLFSKPYKGKQGFHNFACILGILGILTFAVLVEMCAKDIFGDKQITFMIALGVASAFLLLFLILGLVLKDKKKVAKTTEQPIPPVSNVPAYEIADAAADTTVHNDTNDRIWVAEPEIKPTVDEPAAESKTSEYVPDDTKSVRDILDRTYGSSTENVSSNNMKKIQTLRSLLDANAITKDEYIALVNSYLGAPDKK
ncbi:MAG: hypothetical protein NC132_04170 [Corallococcus sp.]|nr:hypothetical protein [Corallococcus sp.]MCM1359855.1 hypothetical protein [Corallococcus sp.]MCM1395289.1 hypothetical protein [Corallococcus sp.]